MVNMMTDIREQIANWDGHVCPACGLPSNTRDTMEKMLAVVKAAKSVSKANDPQHMQNMMYGLRQALAALEQE